MNMHLTDRLQCPRCGPPFGLILLAEHAADGSVREGRLGCPNCRERYLISGGVADLRGPPRRQLAPARPTEPADPDHALRIAAALGLTEGPGVVLITGAGLGCLELLPALVPSVEFVGGYRTQVDSPSVSKTSHVILGSVLPFMPSTFRGVVVDGDDPAAADPGALMTTLAPGGRLLLQGPSVGWAEKVREEGLSVLLDTPEACVVRMR